VSIDDGVKWFNFMSNEKSERKLVVKSLSQSGALQDSYDGVDTRKQKITATKSISCCERLPTG